MDNPTGASAPISRCRLRNVYQRKRLASHVPARRGRTTPILGGMFLALFDAGLGSVLPRLWHRKDDAFLGTWNMVYVISRDLR